MILVVDCCKSPRSLSSYEFVDPIVRIIGSAGGECRVVHYTLAAEESGYEGVVLCGTALADNTFTEDPAAFTWLREAGAPVLGICAGMQVLSLLWGGSLMPDLRIGMTILTATDDGDPLLSGMAGRDVYELHKMTPTLPPGFLAVADSDGQLMAFRHPERPVWGVLFHPEVRNEWVVGRFLSVCP